MLSVWTILAVVLLFSFSFNTLSNYAFAEELQINITDTVSVSDEELLFPDTTRYVISQQIKQLNVIIVQLNNQIEHLESSNFNLQILSIVIGIFGIGGTMIAFLYGSKKIRRNIGKLLEDYDHAKKVAGSEGGVKFRINKKIISHPPDVERKDIFVANKEKSHSTDTFVAEKTKKFRIDAILKKSEKKIKN